MKRYLIAGLLVWAPLGITIWVINFLVTTLDQTLLLVLLANADQVARNEMLEIKDAVERKAQYEAEKHPLDALLAES